MKQFLSVFFALSLIALAGCESDNGASSLDFEGEWAYVGEYDNEDGWDYYPEESNFYAAITDNTVDIYGAWDDYYFQNGYYPCSRDDFSRYHCRFTFTIENGRAVCANNAWEVTHMEIKAGKLYMYDANDSYGYCEMYERIKGFLED